MKAWFDVTRTWLSSQIRSEKGQGMVEYGLILVLIAVVVIAVIGVIGNNLNTAFNKVATNIK